MNIRKILAKWLYPKAFEKPFITISQHHCYTILDDDSNYIGFLNKYFVGQGTHLDLRGLFICSLETRLNEARRLDQTWMIPQLEGLIKTADRAQASNFLDEATG